MPTLKSPGQKKKKVVRAISFLLFFVITASVYFAKSSSTTSSLEWTKNHIEITAIVSSVDQYEEEYRNLKGRKRIRDAYEVTYNFVVDGASFINTQKIDEDLYIELYETDPLVVWYESDNPENSDLKSNLTKEIENNSNTMRKVVTAIPFGAIGAFVVYYLLSFIFVRESKNVLPEGFYTDNTWLDVDDNYLVALDDGDLVFLDIHKKQSGKVQKLYQINAPLEEIIATSKSSKFNRVPIAEITKLSSDHNMDTISIKYKGKSHSVEFLNPALKQHALERIQPLLSDSIVYEKIEKTRFKAALPVIIFALILSAIIVFTSSAVINLIIGLVILTKVIPAIISRFIDPTITEKWEAVATEA